MKRPARYFVPYEDQQLWQRELARVKARYPDSECPEDLTEPTNYWRDRDFSSLKEAQAFANEHGNDVYERVGITPDPDAPGLWDWQDRLLI